MPSEGCTEGRCSHPVLSSVLQQGLQGKKMCIVFFQQRDCFTWEECSWAKNLASLLCMSFSRGDFSCSLVRTGHKADRATSAWQRLEDVTSLPFFHPAGLSEPKFWSITGLWLFENRRMESVRNNSRCPFRVQVFSVCVGLGKKYSKNMVDIKMSSWR